MFSGMTTVMRPLRKPRTRTRPSRSDLNVARANGCKSTNLRLGRAVSTSYRIRRDLFHSAGSTLHRRFSSTRGEDARKAAGRYRWPPDFAMVRSSAWRAADPYRVVGFVQNRTWGPSQWPRELSQCCMPRDYVPTGRSRASHNPT